MTDLIIETNQLTKSFQGRPVLRGLDLCALNHKLAAEEA